MLNDEYIKAYISNRNKMYTKDDKYMPVVLPNEKVVGFVDCVDENTVRILLWKDFVPDDVSAVLYKNEHEVSCTFVSNSDVPSRGFVYKDTINVIPEVQMCNDL